MHWHNTQRLHGYLGDIPPAEFEQKFYADQTTADQLGALTPDRGHGVISVMPLP